MIYEDISKLNKVEMKEKKLAVVATIFSRQKVVLI